ncbi:hypothetical protein ACFQT0_10525 [Hymenobacter humi]|uniref:Uncharacterized protein n=1 Tax=Hymenobacter humi TaxID=1411620 RepID=A0ABW2U4J0_9BACT
MRPAPLPAAAPEPVVAQLPPLLRPRPQRRWQTSPARQSQSQHPQLSQLRRR